MANAKTVSRAGYEKLQEEREYLVTVKRKEVAQKLKEARSFGDLSENAEYDEAKNEQAILESRINELELLIANAIVVEDHEVSTDEIGVGSIIKIKDLELNEILSLMRWRHFRSSVPPSPIRTTERSPTSPLSAKQLCGKRLAIFLKWKLPQD